MDNGCWSKLVWRANSGFGKDISVQQFLLDQFLDSVREVLRNTGIEPNHLCLEITEYAAVQDLERSIVVMKKMEDIGVRIAIDDFGIGQSPFVLLKHLPIHSIKIDRKTDDVRAVQSVFQRDFGSDSPINITLLCDRPS